MTEGRVVLEWAPGWAPVDADSGFDRELRAELDTSHPLASMSPTVVGRCLSCDDVVAALVHAPGEAGLAVIHLTWQGRRRRDASQTGLWPHFERVTTAAFMNRFLRGGEHL
jgi:hypothetical protein